MRKCILNRKPQFKKYKEHAKTIGHVYIIFSVKRFGYADICGYTHMAIRIFLYAYFGFGLGYSHISIRNPLLLHHVLGNIDKYAYLGCGLGYTHTSIRTFLYAYLSYGLGHTHTSIRVYQCGYLYESF